MLSPQIKIILTLIYVIVLFMISSLIGYGIIFIGLMIVCFIVKRPVFDILKLLKKILPIIIFTAVINMFFIDGKIIWSMGTIAISDEGIRFAVLMVVRIIFLVVGSSLLIYTTTPLLLAHGIESLVKPFQKIGFPAKEFAMIMMIALRFVPILELEASKITIAQKARGISSGKANIFKKAKSLNAIIIPLLISIFRRSEQIAIAMESRCYDNR